MLRKVAGLIEEESAEQGMRVGKARVELDCARQESLALRQAVAKRSDRILGPVKPRLEIQVIRLGRRRDGGRQRLLLGG